MANEYRVELRLYKEADYLPDSEELESLVLLITDNKMVADLEFARAKIKLKG